jgi:hypothetical protein
MNKRELPLRANLCRQTCPGEVGLGLMSARWPPRKRNSVFVFICTIGGPDEVRAGQRGTWVTWPKNEPKSRYGGRGGSQLYCYFIWIFMMIL